MNRNYFKKDDLNYLGLARLLNQLTANRQAFNEVSSLIETTFTEPIAEYRFRCRPYSRHLKIVVTTQERVCKVFRLHWHADEAGELLCTLPLQEETGSEVCTYLPPEPEPKEVG